jgi:hypothetical protein
MDLLGRQFRAVSSGPQKLKLFAPRLVAIIQVRGGTYVMAIDLGRGCC